MALEYTLLPKLFVYLIHDQLELEAPGFNLQSNFDYLFDTINEFPESAGIIPQSTEEKIIFVASYLIFHLTKGHPFNDGNKRTAFLSFSIFLMQNGLSPHYSEAKSNEALDKITELIQNKKRPLEAIEDTFKGNPNSNEYKLIRLLFELSGANPVVQYNSPIDIYPKIRELVIRREDEKFGHPWLVNFVDGILKKLQALVGSKPNE